MRIICPICKKITTWEENPWRPFCSKRCKLIDLGKWIEGEYKINSREYNEENRKKIINNKLKGEKL